MTDIENKIEQNIERRYERRSSCTQHSGNRVWTGLFILLIGVAALLKSMLLPLPYWLFSWPMILVALGVFIGIRHNFRGGAWFALMLIGGAFLLDDIFPNVVEQRFIWPIALIVLGAFLIFKPRGRRHLQWQETGEVQNAGNDHLQLEPSSTTTDDLLESTSVFGGIKKSILSKNFKGGEVVNIMGGSEINLSQADIKGRAVLEVTQIFGGTKIIVPSNWEVKPEMAAIFGGIEDKRYRQNATIDHSKLLIIKGTSVFGGIEIKSF